MRVFVDPTVFKIFPCAQFFDVIQCHHIPDLSNTRRGCNSTGQFTQKGMSALKYSNRAIPTTSGCSSRRAANSSTNQGLVR